MTGCSLLQVVTPPRYTPSRKGMIASYPCATFILQWRMARSATEPCRVRQPEPLATIGSFHELWHVFSRIVARNFSNSDILHGLKMDEWFDIPDYPNDGRSISTFRSRLGQYKSCSTVKFLVRALPSGGIRVIRVGTWFGEVSNKVYPVLKRRMRKSV